MSGQTNSDAVRCRDYRLKILEISQKVTALHAGAAFSCLEILDCIYFRLINKDSSGIFYDKFILSKGHGGVALYVILEKLGIIDEETLYNYCQPEGKLGCHPDYGLPGIEASTGSLGHGLALSVGVAYSEKYIRKSDKKVYVLISDGELQEGSTWESLMMAANLKVSNLIIFLDHNGMQSFGHTEETHPAFYPIMEKLKAFNFETYSVDGHNSEEIEKVVLASKGNEPLFILANTTKGKGVSFMESVPVWHYRSPSPAEYEQAKVELSKIS